MVNISKRMISSDLTMSTDANDGSWSLATKKRSTGTVLNCTPIVRQYDILKNNWGDFLCQREYQTKDIRQSLRSV